MRRIDKALLVLLLIGLADAAYLTLVELNSVQLYCSTTGTVNCSSVITSTYSTVLGIPLAYASLTWFAISLALFFVAIKRDRLLKLRNAWYVLGIGAAVYSTLSMYTLSEICEYCALLDVILVAIAGLVLYESR